MILRIETTYLSVKGRHQKQNIHEILLSKELLSNLYLHLRPQCVWSNHSRKYRGGTGLASEA
jgi:hypothetical protein